MSRKIQLKTILMDKKLHETTDAGVEIKYSRQLTTSKQETWSRGTNSCLLFDVNVMLNLSNVDCTVKRATTK